MSEVHADSVAIVGMAGRFPGAPDLDAFWELLISGGDAIGPVPPERWDSSEVLDPVRDIQAVGGFLEGVDRFDAGFFGISPREAQVTDPQQRLMLETVWRALEDAGQPAAGLRGTRTGVYAGGLWHDYELLRKDAGAGATTHSIVGNSLDIVSSRISYFLGLTGPSLTVESSCSSSLVALHQACQALRHGEIDAALVGGSNLMLTPEVTVGLTHFGGLSPTGRCHAFGAGADGFVRGEGVAVVYLKPLAHAVRDGDPVRAVIVGSAVNNDGGGDSLVTPHPAAQSDLLRRVYGQGRVPPERLAYVEAHGTGTVRGDAAEAAALGEVLGAPHPGRRLHIGSVKTNIGHLEPAAGLAGLIKAVLSLEHGTVPPSLHAGELNPSIDFEALNLAVAREPLPLAAGSHVGVNSFGWGGTNAHVVVTAPAPVAPASLAPAPLAPPSAGPAPAGGGEDGESGDEDRDTSLAPFLLPLSAHSPQALERRTADVRERVEAGARARDMATALGWYRDHFPQRLALLGPDLTQIAAGRARQVGKVALVFPGQGAQWHGMGAGLYGHHPAFTSAMDACARALSAHVPWDVRDLVTGGPERPAVHEVQPALWAMSVSLAAAWADAGVRADVVVGHSQGEIAAATVAGALTLDEGALVASRRSDLLRRVSGAGRMLAVDLGPQDALRALDGFEGLVELAVHNGPRSCVLSGDADSVLLLKEILEADEVFCRLVDVDYGSHSPQIDAIGPEIRTALADISPGPGHTALFSTVDAHPREGTGLDAAYWAANLRGRVRFAESVERLLDDGVTHIVEVSPHPGLGTALRQIGEAREEPPAVLATLRRGEGAPADLLRAFGAAYVSGLDVRGPRPARRPALTPPPYPFQRERHWVPARRADAARAGGSWSAPLLPSTAGGVWESARELSLTAHPWLADHRVHGTPVFPAGGCLALAQSALTQATGAPAALREVELRAALALGEEPVRLALTWRPGTEPSGVLALTTAEEGGRTGHCRALASAHGPQPPGPFPAHLLAADPLDAGEFYARCARRHLDYGPAFRSVTAVHRAPDEALVRLELPAGSPGTLVRDALHPVLWDGILQAALAVDDDGPVLPVSIGAAAVAATGARTLWAHARRADAGYAISVYDAGRAPVGGVDGLELAQAPAAPAAGETAGHVFRMVFTPEERPETTSVTVAAYGQTRLLPDGLDAAEFAKADRVVWIAPDAEANAPDPGANTPDLGTTAQEAGASAPGAEGIAPGAEGNPLGAGPSLLDALTRLTDLVRRCAAESPAGVLTLVVRDGDPAAGAYAGLLAAVQAEHPRLGARLVETDTFGEALAAELAASEDRVVLRAGARLVGRRVRGGTGEVPAPWRTGGGAPPFRQGVARPGSLDTLCGWPLERTPPAAGHVEVAVDAASLNFIDVMKAMGVYPDDSPDRDLLGLDCAGTVSAVGPGVSGIEVGDHVVACGFGALASHLTADARHVVPRPGALSAAQAAALPMVLATAWHALVDVARAEAGETVLVHSATGGLGLAALAVARHAGLRVIATAGTPEKRRHLRGLGVEHVFDSRGLEWAAGVREATGGRGVDIVLNSLAGAAIPLGMEALAEDGRFVELGKRDIHAATSVDLSAFKKSVTFAAVDIAGMLRRRPDRFASLLRRVWDEVETGALGPLPVTTRGFAEAEDAFRTLSRGQHLGKLVLTDPGGRTSVRPLPLPGGRYRAGGTYLVTGGLGALGMSLAEHLADSGAGAIALLSRSAPAEPERVERLRACGVRVGVWCADVADEARMEAVLGEIRATLPPLRGVFHAAGILDDATLDTLDAERLARVLRPKADGARVLHRLTTDDALDLFVLFSSAAAFVGTAGQAAYAAANGCLDGLALARRRAGLPGLSVQWGPVREVGLAAAHSGRGDRLADRGLAGIGTDACWSALRGFVESDEAVVAYAALDPRRWLETYPATAALSSWRQLAEAGGDTTESALHRVPPQRRRTLVEELVRRDAGHVLRLDPGRLPADVPLKSLGLDSLMSLELRNRLETSLGLRLSPTLLWKHGSLVRLGAALCALLDTEAEAPRG